MSALTLPLLVPLVLAGDLRGRIFEGDCEGAGARSRLSALRALHPGRPIVLSTGDLLGPEPLSGFAFRGPPTVKEALRTLFAPEGRPVLDAVALGNFELSAPAEQLEALIEARVGFTAANVIRTDGVRPHRVVVRSGLRVGITAVVDGSVTSSLDAMQRARVRPAAPALDAATRALRRAGVDVVVGMVHVRRSSGVTRVIELLSEVENRPELVLTSPLNGDPALVRVDGLGTVIVPAPPGPGAATVIEWMRRPEGAPSAWTVDARRVPVEALPSGSADLARNWVCRQLAVPLTGPRGLTASRGDPGRLGGRSTEASLDRATFQQLVLEHMRRAVGAEIAILSRTSIGPPSAFPLSADATRLDVRRALPFDEGLRVTRLPGRALEPVERLAASPGTVSRGLSGGEVAGRPKDELRTYTVVTVDFVAEGGDDLLPPGRIEFRVPDPPVLLREVVADAIREGAHLRFDPTGEPRLFEARASVAASLKSVSVDNPGDAESPQLTRQDFLGISGDLRLRLSWDLPRHRLELAERTRFGVVREAAAPGEPNETRENEDVTTLEMVYAARLSRGAALPIVPDAGATARFETELTVPEERRFRRALLQLGVGPTWRLTSNLSLRSQLGVRRELLASPTSDDPAEASLAETRVAVLSTAELRDEVLELGEGRPVVLDVRVDHTADLTGAVRDLLLQGRIGLDVPITDGLALTAALDIYLLDRDRDGRSDASGGALDTSIGLKSSADLSRAFY